MIAKANRPAKPRVFSYIRFSTPEQKLGDSLRRQIEAAQAWAAKHGYHFDESLRDEGLSGYHGAHRKTGALGGFLARVQAGTVPAGSILVVENIDRLSREGVVDAIKTIIDGLIGKGISIVTLYPESVLDRDTIEDRIWELIGHIKRGNAESKRKSDLISAARKGARDRARADGRTMTSQMPAWLRLDDEGRRAALPEAAATIKLIFELKLKGVGISTIVQRLNAEATWAPPRIKRSNGKDGLTAGGWRGGYVKKILDNRAVIGECQPHKMEGERRTPVGDPIPGYYPKIIEPDVFFAVQRQLDANRGKGGRTGKAHNVLRHLVRCAYCGGTMVYASNAKDRPCQYLVCDNWKRRHGCACHTMRYQECEEVLLENCRRLRPEQVLPDPDEQAAACQALQARLAGIDGELANIEKRLNNLTDQIADSDVPAARRRYEAKLAELEERKAELGPRRAAGAAELAAATVEARGFAAWQANLGTLRTALTRGPEARQRLNAHLREIISKIEVFAAGHPTRYDPAGRPRPMDQPRGDDLADYIESIAGEFAPGLLKDKRFSAFIEHVMRRRMSKEGRLLRVHFKGGARVDLVPNGSLACGMELRRCGKGGWRFVSPDIQQLWDDYQAAHPADAKPRRRVRNPP